MMRYSTCLLALFTALFNTTATPADGVRPPRPVTVRGTLETGIFAIGGETTGTIIKTNGRTYELDLGDNPQLREKAEQLNGQQVIVEGPLRRVRGVEVPARWIIDVQKLEPENGGESPAIRNSTGISIHFRRPDTRVKSISDSSSESGVTLKITSSTGIDSGRITRTGDSWPTPFGLVLHLKGLELLRVSNRTESLQWSITSGFPEQVRAVRLPAGEQNEQPLAPENRWYAAVTVIPSESNRNQQAYCVTLPKPFLASNPESIEIQFVDFYR